jgi:hypothetical protein
MISDKRNKKCSTSIHLSELRINALSTSETGCRTLLGSEIINCSGTGTYKVTDTVRNEVQRIDKNSNNDNN